MKYLLISVSIIGLLLTIVPSTLVLAGILTAPVNKNLMAIGMILWFLTAPGWLNQTREEGER
jgi:hypothetical protein